jgi:hypothetical protein
MIVIPQQSSAMMRQFAAFGKPLQQSGLDAKADLQARVQKKCGRSGENGGKIYNPGWHMQLWVALCLWFRLCDHKL